MSKRWEVKRGGLGPVGTVEGLKEILLAQRGLDLSAARSFFMPRYDSDIHDPFLLFGMGEAVERVWRAVKKGERIVIYGDYDADGVTSLAILYLTLRELGAVVSPYVPHRHQDGYGLNLSVLQRLRPEMDLLMTVDCGITGVVEAEWLKKEGVDVIITDHHSVPDELPEALAIIHPQHPKGSYPWPSLCGAGVAWKMASALLADKRSKHAGDGDRAKWLLDLAALGTLADVVPLLGENRAIVRFGLEVLRRTPRVGLRRLFENVRVEQGSLTAEDMAFRVIPRINAVGRMDHAQPALDLLLADKAARADEAIAALTNANQQRQTWTKRIMQEAQQQASALSGGVIFAHSPEWPAGVVGLAAGRLAEKFARPAVVVGGAGAHAVGSARSPAGVNVLELLRSGEKYLTKLGGHKQAAGFTVLGDNVENFFKALSSAAGAFSEEVWLLSDAVLEPRMLGRGVVSMLDEFAPYGEANPRPQFVMRGIHLAEMRAVGKEGDHAKCTFECEGDWLDGIGFGLAEQFKSAGFSQGQLVDVIGEIEENEFRGRRRLQVNIKDMEAAGRVMIIERED